jgi:hypothetical protein
VGLAEGEVYSRARMKSPGMVTVFSFERIEARSEEKRDLDNLIGGVQRMGSLRALPEGERTITV